jgi:serine/threonine protein kinase/Tol biopolymer transport system component
MALGVGSRIGAYQITGELGAGGMGEVYRATDTNLRRDVAIKILPPAFANDADRIARFQREGEALAALNHPNIAQIYGLERSGESAALAMELVEGPTLAERIAEGPIPADEALDIAAQIADALEAAHEQHIVHRDLKPANVKLRPDGTVKVLDFGIATAPESAVATSGQLSSTPALTEAGVRLGTAAYMSPEQARGRTVDRRADIWAFGCVLYEMLTGQPAFGGEDVTTTLARVLEREANTTALPGGLSPAVRRTIELCLRKDVRKRVRDIGDVKLALVGAFETEPSDAAVKETVARPLWRRALPLSAALVVGGLLAVGLTWRLTRPAQSVPAPVSRFVITPPPAAPLDLNQGGNEVAISPDGKRLAYVARDPRKDDVKLYVRDLDGLSARAVPGPYAAAGANANPFFSPGGQSIGFRSRRQGIMRVSLNGGPALKIVDNASIKYIFHGAAWTPDGTLIYASAHGLYSVSVSGDGTPKQLTRTPDGTTPASPVLLPGGHAVLFDLTSDDAATERVVVLNLQTGEAKTLIEDGLGASYAPTGHIVFIRGTTLMAVPFDADRLAVTGQPVALLQGIRHPIDPIPFSAANYALSDTGTLVYVPSAAENAKSALVWVNREGDVVERAVADLLESPRNPRLSPDGRRVVLTSGPLADGDVWVYDLAGRPPIPLATKENDPLAIWSPDSTRVAYLSLRSISIGRTTADIYIAPADGSVPDGEPLRHDALPAGPAVWSAEGELILVRGTAESDIVATSADGKGKVRDVVATPDDEYDPALSPNGVWLAYTSNRTGRPEIWVKGYPDGVAMRVSANGGREPVWSHDGKELFYLQGNAMMAVPVKAEQKFSFDVAKKLFNVAYFVAADPAVHSYDVASDGRFLMIQPNATSAQPDHIVVVQNWFEELKRRMSTK